MARERKETGFVSSTRVLGRKRVHPSWVEASSLSSPFSTTLRKRRGRKLHLVQSNCLESLPQDVLVKVLCKVNHSDLKQLLLVSKFVSTTASVARELHFKYSTPLSKRNLNNKDCDSEGVDEATPDAPMQHSVARSRLDTDRLASLAIALFASPKEQRPSKDSLTGI